MMRIVTCLCLAVSMAWAEDGGERVSIDLSGRDASEIVPYLARACGDKVDLQDIELKGKVYLLGEKSVERPLLFGILEKIAFAQDCFFNPPSLCGGRPERGSTRLERRSTPGGVYHLGAIEVHGEGLDEGCPPGVEWAIGVFRLTKADRRTSFSVIQSMVSDPRLVTLDDATGVLLVLDRPAMVNYCHRVLETLEQLGPPTGDAPPPPK